SSDLTTTSGPRRRRGSGRSGSCAARPPTCRPPSSSRSPTPPSPIFAGSPKSSRTWRGGEAMARILIVGGGYLGLYAAHYLERRLPTGGHDLVIVSPENDM